MRRKEIIIKTKGVNLKYKPPFLICNINGDKTKINEGAIASISILEVCEIDTSIYDLLNKQAIVMTIQNGKSHPLVRCVPYSMKYDKDPLYVQIRNSVNLRAEVWKEACNWIDQKHIQRIEVIEKYQNRTDDVLIDNLSRSWYDKLSEMKDQSKSSIRAREAQASKCYWKCYNQCLPKLFRFKLRTKNPGKDLTNALLNYGYGILYSMIDKLIISYGLDPTYGIFHSDGIGKKSLVYDMIEPFRFNIEELVLIFFNENEAEMKKVEFQCNKIPPHVKAMYISYWKNFNRSRGIGKKISLQIKAYKKVLIQLANKTT